MSPGSFQGSGQTNLPCMCVCVCVCVCLRMVGIYLKKHMGG